MIRRLFRFVFKLGVLGSVAAVAVKALDRRRSASSAPDWSASTEPWPPIELTDRQVAETVPAPSESDAAAVAGDVAATPEPEVVPVATGGEDEVVVVASDGEAEVVATAPTDGQAEVVATAPADAAWSDPGDDGSCPASHPVKAKLASKVFHLPGMANYERTKADRCYVDAGAAEADGLRQAKR
jgi:hypothetical protein